MTMRKIICVIFILSTISTQVFTQDASVFPIGITDTTFTERFLFIHHRVITYTFYGNLQVWHKLRVKDRIHYAYVFETESNYQINDISENGCLPVNINGDQYPDIQIQNYFGGNACYIYDVRVQQFVYQPVLSNSVFTTDTILHQITAVIDMGETVQTITYGMPWMQVVSAYQYSPMNPMDKIQIDSTHFGWPIFAGLNLQTLPQPQLQITPLINFQVISNYYHYYPNDKIAFIVNAEWLEKQNPYPELKLICYNAYYNTWEEYYSWILGKDLGYTYLNPESIQVEPDIANPIPYSEFSSGIQQGMYRSEIWSNEKKIATGNIFYVND